MIKKISVHSLVRCTSLVCFALTVALDLLLSGNLSFWDYSVIALSSSLIIHFCPESGEPLRLSRRFCLGTALMMVVLESITCHVACLAAVAMTFVLIYAAIRLAGHYEHLHNNFSVKEIKLSADNLSSWFMFAIAAVLMTALLVFNGNPVVGIAIAPLATAYYAILYYHSYMRRARAMKVQQEAESDSMHDIYDRIVSLMESNKLFLDDDLTMNSLAAAVGTNRTYLSRAVNSCSGKHVPTFINSYRVNYAMEKLKEDPQQRIGEMYGPCGFKTHSNFDMNFKLISGMTPSEYAMTVSVEKLRSGRKFPSKTLEREQ